MPCTQFVLALISKMWLNIFLITPCKYNFSTNVKFVTYCTLPSFSGFPIQVKFWHVFLLFMSWLQIQFRSKLIDSSFFSDFNLKFNSYSIAQSYRFGKPDRSIWTVLLKFLHGFEFGDHPELGALPSLKVRRLRASYCVDLIITLVQHFLYAH